MRVVDILNTVTALYNDVGYARVPLRVYLQFLDTAINQLILARPDVNVKYSTIRLKPGTRQTIPDEGYALLEIIRNKYVRDNSGNTLDWPTFSTPIVQSDSDKTAVISDGPPVYHVRRLDMDFFDDWHSHQNAYPSYPVNTTPKDTIQEYSADVKTPRAFWVSPEVRDYPVYIELSYSYPLERYAQMSDADASILLMTIPISPIYSGMIISYMLYLCYSIDSTSAVDRQTAAMYQTEFLQSIQLDATSKDAAMPKVGE